MANEWHYTLNGQQAAAPIPSAQLKQLATSGQLQPTDMVWQDGMPNWVPASSIKGLFTASRLGPEPAPAPAEDRFGGRRPEVSPPGWGTAPPAAAAPAGPPRDWVDMPPVLVLLLTVCTLGIFGLVYSFKVCLTFAQGQKRTTDGAARPLGQVRHPLWVLMLSYLTCGFYFFYWVHRVLAECDDYSGRKEFKPGVELSLMLLFPPYAVYLAVFRLPDLIRRCQTLAGLPETPPLGQAVVFVNPCLYLALPLLGMTYQDALNQVWFNAP